MFVVEKGRMGTWKSWVSWDISANKIQVKLALSGRKEKTEVVFQLGLQGSRQGAYYEDERAWEMGERLGGREGDLREVIWEWWFWPEFSLSLSFSSDPLEEKYLSDGISNFKGNK